MTSLPRGFKALVVVKQVEAGSRLQAPFGWRGPVLLNAERVAERLFWCAVEGREVTIMDRSR